MDGLCTSCKDVSKNLHQIITSELDFRTGIGKEEYIWNCDVSTIVRAAAEGCTFCSFVDYVFLKPYCDPQSLGLVPTSAASTVEDLSGDTYQAFATSVRDAAKSCLICSGHASRDDGGLCYLCRPRIARYLVTQRGNISSSHAIVTLPLTIAIRKDTWDLYEDTDVEGISLRGYISRHPLNTNEGRFRIDCSSDDPAAEYVHQRPRLCRFDDRRIYAQVRSLLKQCADDHDCGPELPARPDTRPTRLINLGRAGTNDPVRLSSGVTSEPYVALSYCWGGRQALLTKTENLEEHRRAIPVPQLAQSIQDAILLTREMGIRFLWVDCLCIIQNDKQDKSREIAKMRNVYANSYLTICAGRARAAADGFLNLRTDPFRMDAAALKADLTDENSSQAAKAQSRNPEDVAGSLPLMLPDGRTGQVNIRRVVEYSSALEPLVARAWTYEERLLSKRVVTFGQCITWRCLDSHCLLDETGDHWYPGDEDHVNSIRGELHAIALQPKRLLRRWHDLVTAYSERSMYDETDKLPAIAGIVQQIQPDGDPHAYLAGLWRSQLADDLVWCMPHYGTKPSKWRAPSWSWAALNGMVRFQDAADVVYGSTVLISDVVSDIQVDNEASPFGELCSASLYVTGRIGIAERGLIARKGPNGKGPPAFAEILCNFKDPTTTIYEGTSRLKIDVAEDSLQHSGDEQSSTPKANQEQLLRSEPVWCLPLHGVVEFEPDQAWADERLETRMDGLLLRKNADGSYRRIGIFEVAKVDDGRYFTWGEPERIHLV